jgi:hypothetical protein
LFTVFVSFRSIFKFVTPAREAIKNVNRFCPLVRLSAANFSTATGGWGASNTFFLLSIDGQSAITVFPPIPTRSAPHSLLAKSKSYSVVPAQQTEALKERLKRLNDLEKESGASIDQTSSDEDNEKVIETLACAFVRLIEVLVSLDGVDR